MGPTMVKFGVGGVLDSIKDWVFFDYLCDCQLLKKNYAAWSCY